jgi:hypothetical protein
MRGHDDLVNLRFPRIIQDGLRCRPALNDVAGVQPLGRQLFDKSDQIDLGLRLELSKKRFRFNASFDQDLAVVGWNKNGTE